MCILQLEKHSALYVIKIMLFIHISETPAPKYLIYRKEHNLYLNRHSYVNTIIG